MEDGRIRSRPRRGRSTPTTRSAAPASVRTCTSGPSCTFAGNIALWRDRYTPPAGEEDELLGAYPYLGPDFAFLERVPGEAPLLADIHVFGIGATMSFGPSGSSINAMTTAVRRWSAGLTRGLFAGDLGGTGNRCRPTT